MTQDISDPPAWLARALDDEPEYDWIEVDGVKIRWAAWGKRGRPGVLLLTGNGAHIGWWRPIAPFLAQDFRVATFDWSGMGASGWRDEYPIATFLEEAMGVCEAAGLFVNGAPFVAAHSFGGFLGLHLVVQRGARFAGGILIDSRLRLRKAWGSEAPKAVPFRHYATREEAIARFRLVPDQPTPSAFALQRLAEESVEAIGEKWRFRQDPDLRRKTPLDPDLIPLIPAAQCPLVFIRGELSSSVIDEIWQAKMAAARPGTPFIEIPEGHHHLMVDQPIALITAIRAGLCFLDGPDASKTDARRRSPI